MDKSNVYYDEALNYYHKGYIDKSIVLCEKSISNNIKNKASINLKGLLYYLKGDIKNSRALWKLNYQVNKDKVAKNYLESLERDEKRFQLYIEAVKKIKEMKINEALDLLLECEDSDFNTIDVNNYLCMCYIRKGDLNRAKEKLERVMQIDRNNYMALENRKTLIKYGEIKSKVNIKPYFYGVCFIGVCIIILFSFKPLIKLVPNLNLMAESHKSNIKANVNNLNIKNGLSNTVKNDENGKGKYINLQFPYDEYKKALDNKDYEKIYDYTEKWKNQNLQINYKEVIIQGEKLLGDEGVAYFYKEGSTFFYNKDYDNGVKSFLKASNYGKDNYLYPHIIYFIASSYENLSDYENALKFYSIYDNNFSKGDYEEIVLYNMIIINKDIDMEKAKQYAVRLSDNYPNSIYNNSIIKSILKN